MTWKMRVSGRRTAGQRAGSVSHKGYMEIGIFGVKYYLHHIIWLWMTGRWPDPEVDHKNHEPSDNRWDNLLENTHIQNSHNQSLRSTNESGCMGVWQHPDTGVYYAYIWDNGRKIHLGNFIYFEDARAARKAAERKYGYHVNHGEPRQ
jgi:HNH endonuclease/AP2 domain